MPIADLKPAPYNPRRIEATAVAGLRASIERFGNVQPIVWNRRSGYVVGGHQRLKVLEAKRVKTTDVVVSTTMEATSANKPQGVVVRAADKSNYERLAADIACAEAHIAGLQAQLEQSESRYSRAEVLLREKEAEISGLKQEFAELKSSRNRVILRGVGRALRK